MTYNRYPFTAWAAAALLAWGLSVAYAQDDLQAEEPPEPAPASRPADTAPLWGAIAPATRPSGTAGARPGLVTNMFYDTSLRQALSDIAAQTHVIIVPDVSVRGIVTCELKDVPLAKALTMLLSSGGFIWKQMDGFILVSSPEPKAPSFLLLSETRRLRLNYLKADAAIKMLPEPLAVYAKADKESNSVCVMAPP